MIAKYKWAVAECLGRKIGFDDYTYTLASDAVDLLIELGWCPPAPPSDAEVEAAARAMFDVADEQMHFPTKFDRAPDPLADTYRRMARAALVAAREVRAND